MKRVKLSFVRYTDSKFLTRCQAVRAGMINNDNFPTPTPTMVVLGESLELYSGALNAAGNRGKAEVALKNQRRAELTALMVQLGTYVNMTAAGDETKLATTYFDLTKSREPSAPIYAPEIKEMTSGINPGELLLVIGKVKNARLYTYQYTADPLTDESNWQGETATLTKYLFTGLQSGKKYWFRVTAYGVKGQVAYSNPIARVVQ